MKYQFDSTLDWYKARLFAKEYTQTYGIDDKEMFALVAKMNKIRILLSLIAHTIWELHQFDVKTSLPHEDSEEEVYMEIPPAYVVEKT